MQTLGIDLAGQNSPSGLVWLDWDPRPRVTGVDVRPITNEHLSELAQQVIDVATEGWVAIDAPFGYPRTFTAAIADLEAGGLMEALGDRQINWRVTEILVRNHPDLAGFNRYPLSTVTQQITGTVLRCLDLLSQVERLRGAIGAETAGIDRVGFQSHIFETYPIACLRLWGLVGGTDRPEQDRRLGYKSEHATEEQRSCARDEIVAGLTKLAPSLATSEADCLAEIRESDDAIDALVCALVAGLVGPEGDKGSTAPSAEEQDVARMEGWIHLPRLQ